MEEENKTTVEMKFIFEIMTATPTKLNMTQNMARNRRIIMNKSHVENRKNNVKFISLGI